MSATADKARFYLEQSVPELKELEKKKVFTPEEISSIARKRSDFEHKINARGSSGQDYASYAEFEINVDRLRQKRVKRLGIRLGTSYHGQRRIFFVLDRGMRKFPGDLRLWMQSIEYARKQKALKKVTQILTNGLRLHPTNVELWIYAAQFALDENGDMTEARGYMQRGLRFCKNSRKMWLQNFRLELSWIAKIHARRQILGLEAEASKQEDVRVIGEDDDALALENEDGETDKVDVTALARLNSAPIMTGAIPVAIFDAAMKHFQNDPELALNFHGECSIFRDVPAVSTIRQHIDDHLQTNSTEKWEARACHISQALTADPSSVEFPAAVRQILLRINSSLSTTKQRAELVGWCKKFLQTLLENDDLDPAIEQVLRSKVQSLV